MGYLKPEFVEIRMDAEIGAYQNDFDPEREPSFAAPRADSPGGAPAETAASDR
jgi:hypothetical protein